MARELKIAAKDPRGGREHRQEQIKSNRMPKQIKKISERKFYKREHSAATKKKRSQDNTLGKTQQKQKREPGASRNRTKRSKGHSAR